MEKIRLIWDFSHLCHRCAHANSGLQTASGESTGVIFGVLRSLRMMCDKYRPSQVIFAADRGTSFRKQVLKEYKASRGPTSQQEADDREAFFEEVSRCETMLELLGIPVIGHDGLEADDICAIICRSIPFDGVTIVVSGDKDLLQLVNHNTKYYNPNSHYECLVAVGGYDIDPAREPALTAKEIARAAEISPESFTYRSEKMGKAVPFDRWMLYRAMVGDSSDELPGIKGVGPAAALKVVSVASTVNQAIELKESIPGLNVSQRAAMTQKDLQLQYDMIDLIGLADSAPGQAIAGMLQERIEMRSPDLKTFRTLLIRYQMSSMLNDLDTGDWIKNIPSCRPVCTP